jgi:dolichyl-phosphate beta-glucosyltransferase
MRERGQGSDIPDYVTVERPRAAGKEATRISVVVPAYNEAARIAQYLDRIVEHMNARGASFEILVVDDGSSDRTVEVVRGCMERHGGIGLVTYAGNRGKGHAVRVGMLASRGEIRLFTDADGSTPIEEFEKLHAKIVGEGFDVAVGSRMLKAPGVERKVTLHRFAMGQVFYVIRRMLLDVQVLDSQCGFKACTVRAAESIFRRARIDGFAFDVEMLYLARRLGLRVAEVPVSWHDSRGSRVNLVLDPFRMVMDIIRIRRLRHRV